MFPRPGPRLPNLGLPSGQENTMGFFSKLLSSAHFETEVWFHNHFLANNPKETAEGMKHHLICVDAKEVKRQKLQQRVLETFLFCDAACLLLQQSNSRKLFFFFFATTCLCE